MQDLFEKRRMPGSVLPPAGAPNGRLLRTGCTASRTGVLPEEMDILAQVMRDDG